MPINWRDYGIKRRKRVELPPPAPEPVVELASSPNYGCNTYPRKREYLANLIRIDEGAEPDPTGKTGNKSGCYCDCCGRRPVVIFPLFNRLQHTARLCEECLTQGLVLLNKEYNI